MPPKNGSRTSGSNSGLCSINSDSFSNCVSLVWADELSLKVVSKTPVLLELVAGAAVVILADSLVFSSEGMT